MQPYVLRMQYLLVNERALVQSGRLPDNNLAALLFRLEHNRKDSAGRRASGDQGYAKRPLKIMDPSMENGGQGPASGV